MKPVAKRPRRGLVLVTGASSGIGRAYAERFARDGWDLLVVARRRDRLDALSRELEAAHACSVEVIGADLCDAADLKNVENRVEVEPRLEVLVNNAGSLNHGSFVDQDRDAEEWVNRLLIVPVLRVIHAALPGMLSRGTGTIINVSSIEGLRPSPNYANYAAAKAYVNVLTQALDEEYGSQGIRFQAVCPGPTQTEIWEKAGIDTTGYDLSRWVTPEDVVEASLLSLQRRELVCVPGAPGRGEWIRRVVPQRVLRRAAGILRRLARV